MNPLPPSSSWKTESPSQGQPLPSNAVAGGVRQGVLTLRLRYSALPLMRLLALVLVTIVGFIIMSRLDPQTLLDALHSARLELIGVALLANAMYLATKGLRWWLLLGSFPGHISIMSAMRISTLGILLSSIYPGLGETSRVLLLRRRRTLSVASATMVVLEERLIDTCTLVALLLISLLSSTSPLLGQAGYRAESWPFLASASLLIAVSLAAVIAVLISRRWSPAGRTASLVQRPLEFGRAMVSTGQQLLRQPALLAGVIAATVLSQLLGLITGWAGLLAFGVDASLLTVVLFITAINLGLGLIPTPAGLGLYQAAGLAILTAGGTRPELAIMAATGLQTVNYGITLLGGLICAILELRPVQRTTPLSASQLDSHL